MNRMHGWMVLVVLGGCTGGSTSTNSTSSSSSSSSGGAQSSSASHASSAMAPSSSAPHSSSTTASVMGPSSAGGSSAGASSSSEIAQSSSEMASSATSMMPDGTPTLESFSISPTTVNTDPGPATITLTFRIVDDMEGLSTFAIVNRVIFQSIGMQQAEVHFTADDLVMGDAVDGTYSVALTLPRYSRGGIWTLKQFDFADAGGHGRTMVTASFQTRGFPTTFTNEGTMSDTDAPSIDALSITPASVDTDAMAQMITVELTLSDMGSGIADPPTKHSFRLAGPAAAHPINVEFTSSARVSGNAASGVYRVNVTIPHYAEKGTWKMTALTVWDASLRVKALVETDLTQAGLAHSFEQTGQQEDTQAPVLTSLTVMPTTVDRMAPNAAATFTFHINDNLAGLSSYFGASTIYVKSPSGTVNPVGFSGANRSGSGTDQDSDYTAVFGVYPGSEVGAWTISSMVIGDWTGNSVTLTTQQLQSMGLATGFTVQ